MCLEGAFDLMLLGPLGGYPSTDHRCDSSSIRSGKARSLDCLATHSNLAGHCVSTADGHSVFVACIVLLATLLDSCCTTLVQRCQPFCSYQVSFAVLGAPSEVYPFPIYSPGISLPMSFEAFMASKDNCMNACLAIVPLRVNAHYTLHIAV